MAFKRKEDTGSGEQFKFEKVGQKLVGYYLGSFDFEGDFGPTKKHLFKTDKGVKIVFGQAHLTSLLTDAADPVPKGVLVQVTYEESKKTKKGSPMKVYAVDIDDEQQLDSAEIPDTDEVLDDEPIEEVNDEDETPTDAYATGLAKRPPTANAPSQSTQANVKAMLNRSKAKTA